MSFFDDWINPFSNTNSLSPVTQAETLYNAVKHPRATLAYLDDHSVWKHPTFRSVLTGIGGPAVQALDTLNQGQAAANKNDLHPERLSEQDLYRMQSTTSKPTDNPFADQQYEKFQRTYDSHSRPRVYTTGDEFVFPDTKPVQQNTALIPSTGQPAPPPAAFGPEVTAASATPGAIPPQVTDTVANQFRIPTQQRRTSARTVF